MRITHGVRHTREIDGKPRYGTCWLDVPYTPNTHSHEQSVASNHVNSRSPVVATVCTYAVFQIEIAVLQLDGASPLILAPRTISAIHTIHMPPLKPLGENAEIRANPQY